MEWKSGAIPTEEQSWIQFLASVNHNKVPQNEIGRQTILKIHIIAKEAQNQECKKQAILTIKVSFEAKCLA